MAMSKTIAGLMGPTLIALAAALLVNIDSISALVEPVSHDPALVMVFGMLSFVAGLAVVRVHNHWAAAGWFWSRSWAFFARRWAYSNAVPNLA